MKKELLNESEIRKMMKFASLGPLADGFVTRVNETAGYGLGEDLYEVEGEEEEEEAGLEEPMGDEPLLPDEGPPAEEPPVDLDAEEPVPGGEEAVDADPEMVKGLVMDLIDMVMVAAKEKFGAAAPEGEVTEEPPGEEEPMGLEEPMPDEAPMDAGEMPEMPPAPGEEELPPEDLEEDLYLEDDSLEEDFVNEVTRRVASRLVRATKTRKRS